MFSFFYHLISMVWLLLVFMSQRSGVGGGEARGRFYILSVLLDNFTDQTTRVN